MIKCALFCLDMHDCVHPRRNYFLYLGFCALISHFSQLRDLSVPDCGVRIDAQNQLNIDVTRNAWQRCVAQG